MAFRGVIRGRWYGSKFGMHDILGFLTLKLHMKDWLKGERLAVCCFFLFFSDGGWAMEMTYIYIHGCFWDEIWRLHEMYPVYEFSLSLWFFFFSQALFFFLTHPVLSYFTYPFLFFLYSRRTRLYVIWEMGHTCTKIKI
ncbi:hypothetical protein GGI42DRAFT_311505 [Trichoderma sp. SZMC 28013]